MRIPTACAATAAAAILLATASAQAVVPCPPSTVTMSGVTSSITTAAVFDTSAVYSGHVRWDMTAGDLYLYSGGTLTGILFDVLDDFDVTGVPAGTPVTLSAELTVDGAVWTDGCGGSGCGGYYWVRLYHGADSLEVLHADHLFTGRNDHHDVVTLPVTITAGQPERLRVNAKGARSPGGGHQSEAHCVLRFRNLPQGVDVVSCKGFPGMAVPARPTTWGRIKTIHR